MVFRRKFWITRVSFLCFVFARADVITNNFRLSKDLEAILGLGASSGRGRGRTWLLTRDQLWHVQSKNANPPLYNVQCAYARVICNVYSTHSQAQTTMYKEKFIPPRPLNIYTWQSSLWERRRISESYTTCRS